MLLLKVALFAILLDLCASARILCVFPSPLYSHQSVFQPIWTELSARGHQVTVLTPNPVRNASLRTLREIDLGFTYKLAYEVHNMQTVINTESNLLVLMMHVFFVMNNMTAEQMKYPEVKALLENEEESFDLIMVETHVPAWYGLSKKYGCPIIGISSMTQTNHLGRAMGNLHNPVYYPHINMPFASRLCFWQRIVSTLFDLLDEMHLRYLLYPEQERMIREALPKVDIDLFALSQNLSLLFTHAIPGFNSLSPAIPSIVPLHSMQIKPPGVLPDHLQRFLDGATEGAIYFSLGSTVKSALVPRDKQRVLLPVFAALPYRVLWKFEDAIEEPLPENVIIIPWVPQQDVLRHKNVKLFITQGGIQSIEEGLHFKVPMLGLPFFGDQFHNVIRISELGLGQSQDWQTLTRITFRNSILQIINNQSYYENVARFSQLLTNPSTEPLRKAIWWIEYVIRNKGAKHLRSPLMDVPWYKYYLLDVILFLLLVFLAFLTLVTLACRTISNAFRNIAKNKTE